MIREDLAPSNGRGHIVIVDGSEYAHIIDVQLEDAGYRIPGEMLTWSTDLGPDEIIEVASRLVARIDPSTPARAQFSEETDGADWVEGDLQEVLDHIRTRLSRVALLTVKLHDGQELKWRRSAARLVSSEVEHRETSLSSAAGRARLGSAAILMSQTATEGLRKNIATVTRELKTAG